MKVRFLAAALWGAVAVIGFTSAKVQAQNVIPGTGRRLTEVGDDFEDEKWNFNLQLPKASKNLDGQTRLPGGRSDNGRWYEPELRGEPDIVRRVSTPEGGLPGSKGAMLMQTLWSGIPGRPSMKPQQDDLCADVDGKVGNLPMSQMPSVVVRVYVPPFDKWEQRTGNSFGFRTAVTTTTMKSSGGWRWGGTYRKTEPYWPGMFINFNCKKDSDVKEDSANFVIRGDELGRDVAGPPCTPGWWTLGISYSSNGQAHYYIRQGVGNLTEKDHVVTYFPYGYHAELLETFFFDIVNMDDGKTWSTPWIVDDPMVYVAR